MGYADKVRMKLNKGGGAAEAPPTAAPKVAAQPVAEPIAKVPAARSAAAPKPVAAPAEAPAMSVESGEIFEERMLATPSTPPPAPAVAPAKPVVAKGPPLLPKSGGKVLEVAPDAAVSPDLIRLAREF